MKNVHVQMALFALVAVISLIDVAQCETLSVDYRYKPADWRSLICMPCDPVKTIVWKNGNLDNVNGMSVVPVAAPNAKWSGQEFVAPRVPIVVTHKRAGDLEITEETFVSPIAADASRIKAPFVERVGSRQVLRDWASPKVPCEPAFRHIATMPKQPVHYRFHAEKGRVYTVVFGFCEGAPRKPGERLLDISIDSKARRRLDLAKEYGQNVPVLIPLQAMDEDGDGLIDLIVTTRNDSYDPGSLLNVLWVFEGTPKLNLDELLLGKSSTPPLAHVAGGDNPERQLSSPSVNVVLVRLHNTGKSPVETAPEFIVQNAGEGKAGKQEVAFGEWTVTGTEPFGEVKFEQGKTVLRFAAKSLAPGEERVAAVSLWREAKTGEVPRCVEDVLALRKTAENYWNKLDLPYDCFLIPDKNIQGIIDSSIRNVEQNRDYKNGIPVYQVGPTIYREVSCVDGMSFCELGVMLGREKDVSDSLDYCLSFQHEDGRLWIYGDFWKENGLVTWGVIRYAQLTGDKAWLEKRWRHVEGMVGFIQELRRRSMANPAALNYGLTPDGFGDGGTGGLCAEYTNSLWNLIGLQKAIEGAKMLGKTAEAIRWEEEAENMRGYLKKAMERDVWKDKHGNVYLPNLMGPEGRKISPARAQWAFLQSIHPGKLFPQDDPLVKGSLAMLEAAQVEGLPLESGWIDGGVWPYFSHLQANALIWAGQGQKAAPLLYAIANHAGMLNWWEEQKLKILGTDVGGDMPHNWGSVEFIRQVRFMLALERGDELHLFEGLPAEWTRSGMTVQMKKVLTDFGPLSLTLTISADGKEAVLNVDVPQRIRPAKVLLHLEGWSGRSGTIELPAENHIERKIEINPPHK